MSEMGERRHKREQCKHRNVGVACPGADITVARSDLGGSRSRPLPGLEPSFIH